MNDLLIYGGLAAAAYYFLTRPATPTAPAYIPPPDRTPCNLAPGYTVVTGPLGNKICISAPIGCPPGYSVHIGADGNHDCQPIPE